MICVKAQALVDCQANNAGGCDVNRRPIEVLVGAMGQAIKGLRRQASVGDPEEEAGEEICPVQLSRKPARNRRLLFRSCMCRAILQTCVDLSASHTGSAHARVQFLGTARLRDIQ